MLTEYISCAGSYCRCYGILSMARKAFSITGGVCIYFYFIPDNLNDELIDTSISNSKPSAIFKVNQRSPAPQSTISMDEMVDDDISSAAEPISISLGISIEPADQVEAQINQLRSANSGGSTALVPAKKAPVNPNSTAALANKIVSNAFNFLSGFATPDGMVPLKTFNDWYVYQVRILS